MYTSNRKMNKGNDYIDGRFSLELVASELKFLDQKLLN